MSESLIPLNFPPGLYNTGTVLQSKDRWFAGNLVRFFQGTIQPVGGWAERTLTGATILGTPNASHSWSLNDGTVYIALGTTTNLYLIDANNVVYDITPTSHFEPNGHDLLWQLDNFGSYLTAVYSGDGVNPSGFNNFLQWTGDVSVPAAPAVDNGTDAPFHFVGLVVTPERFAFLLQGEDPLTLGVGAAIREFRANRGGSITTALVD